MSSADFWTRIAAEHWGRSEALTPLDGEFDLNFLAHGSNGSAVLKVMRENCSRALIELQTSALEHLARAAPELCVPHLLRARDEAEIVEARDQEGRDRLLWMVSGLPGRLYGTVKPQRLALIEQVGAALGRLDRALESFEHPGLERDLKWDLRAAAWAREHIGVLSDADRRDFVAKIIEDFEARHLPQLEALPTQAIHNDVNDYNILVTTDAEGVQLVSGIIDFGDMIRAPAVCDLAIAAAYLMLDQPRPLDALARLVAGYHRERPLDESEIALVWPLALTRLAVSVVNADLMKRARPDDPYVVISEAPAWRLLERARAINEDLALGKLRQACGLPACAGAPRVIDWLAAQAGSFAEIFDRGLTRAPQLDLSVAGGDTPSEPFAPSVAELQAAVERAAPDGGPVLGRYAEPRLIYGGPAFLAGDHPASDRRTVHLGIDIFLPAGTPVRAPLDGRVHWVSFEPALYSYGGIVTLEHRSDAGDRFFTLYGHLAREVATRLQPGQSIAAGEAFAELGAPEENGGWPPHLHLQVGLFEAPGADWPGVADADDMDVWRGLSPDPAPLLRLPPGTATAPVLDNAKELARRKAWSGENLKLSYKAPVTVLRGWRTLLFDEMGRTYLDAYNNVPHVGHAHPRLTEVATAQMRLLNTNTRYLHPAQADYAEALSARLPDGLDVCFFLNSASEANELAMRLARAHTGAKDTIVLAAGYHGNTCTAIALSDYKFSGKGGDGAADWVHVAPIPDDYRGPYKRDDPEAGAKYAAEVGRIIEDLGQHERRLCAFISEIFPSVGGQLVPPPGYLPAVYELVRTAGGLCIADEVQTGLGRLGRTFWGFEQQGAEPDMVVLGKPIGNGHPIGVVVTRREIAETFATGMEFFSTFGGSTLSCVIGREVLRIVDEERLPENAERVGATMLERLKALGKDVPAIGDVRGMGFFMGVEMIEADGAPSPDKAAYIVNRLRERRILIGSDGPHDNVLKIRPPLCFSQADAEYLLRHLEEILQEQPIAG